MDVASAAAGTAASGLHVAVWGSEQPRSPVVLVHGAQSWGNAPPPYGFTAQRPLAERRQLLVVDRRWHGASGDVPGEYTSDYLVDAEDVTALLERVGGAHLVGHS